MLASASIAQESKPADETSGIEVEVEELEAQPVVQIRFKATREEIGAKLGQAYGELMAHVAKNKGKRTLSPLARYFEIDGDTIDMAAAIAVEEPIPGTDRIEASELPAGKVASIWHTGPYEGLEKTYAAFETWLAENGYEWETESWEIYVSVPNDQPDSGKTQIFRALKE
jgi:effector-binding domain-containing protein